ncbi:MAG: signal peptidase I [bacterium]
MAIFQGSYNKEKIVSIKNYKELITIFIISFLIVFFINNVITLNAVVPTASMDPTITVNEKVFATRLFSNLKRGDIVVFEYPDNPNKLYVKRLLGLPGDMLFIKNGTIYINGNPLTENYAHTQYTKDFGPYEVPDNKYFMLGDNRDNSNDSRYWDNKFVSSAAIKGKVLFKYDIFPFVFNWFDEVQYNQ